MKILSKLTTLLMMLLLSVSVSSCSNDEPNDDSNDDSGNAESVSIVGNWEHKEGFGYVFEKDGTVIEWYEVSEGDYEAYEYKYEYNSKKKTIVMDDGYDEYLFYDVKLTENRLTITINDEGEEYTETFNRTKTSPLDEEGNNVTFID